MPQIRTGLPTCFFVLLVLLATSAPAQDAGDTQQALDAVATAISEIGDWLEAASEDQSQQENALQQAELAWSTATNSLQEITSQIASSRLRLQALETQQQTLIGQRNAQAALLQEIIRATYMAGQSHFLKTLLNQEDPATAGRMLNYARLFSTYQAEQIASYQQTLTELAALSRDMEQALSTLALRQTALAEERERLDRLRQTREQALIALNNDIASRNAELEQLEVNRAELQDLLDEIARAMEGVRSFDDVPPLPDARGNLPLPLTGTLLSRFGSPYGGGSLQRQGIVIGADEGSPVRAIHPGYVAFANWLRGSGLLVVVDHGEGYVSLYGGNQALAVEAGQWIEADTVIATSGRGTDSLGPGLYFELRYHGQAQDPALWLDGMD